MGKLCRTCNWSKRPSEWIIGEQKGMIIWKWEMLLAIKIKAKKRKYQEARSKEVRILSSGDELYTKQLWSYSRITKNK